MADNIDKALNGLGLKTDSLPNDWMVTIVNPKSGEPAENMTVARFSELLANKMIPLLKINELKKGMNFVSFSLANGESVTLGKIHGLYTIIHGWSSSRCCVVLVNSYNGTFDYVAGKKLEDVPFNFEFVGDSNSPKDLKITSTYTDNPGGKTTFNFAYQCIY